jgi:predicted ATP-dependent serine protease
MIFNHISFSLQSILINHSLLFKANTHSYKMIYSNKNCFGMSNSISNLKEKESQMGAGEKLILI